MGLCHHCFILTRFTTPFLLDSHNQHLIQFTVSVLCLCLASLEIDKIPFFASFTATVIIIIFIVISQVECNIDRAHVCVVKVFEEMMG